MSENVIFMVESGWALKAVRKHIAERQRVDIEVSALCKELGVDQCYRDRIDGTVRGVVFKGKRHSDFKAPVRNGVSFAKKGSAWAARFAAQKGYADQAAAISEHFKIPMSISYKNGWRRIGTMLAECGWLWLGPKGPYAMWVPDVPAEVAKDIAANQSVQEPAASFKLEFPGCRRIEPEEWDILAAQQKLAAKKAKVPS